MIKLLALKSGDIVNIDKLIYMEMVNGGYMMFLQDAIQFQITDDDAANIANLVEVAGKEATKST